MMDKKELQDQIQSQETPKSNIQEFSNIFKQKQENLGLNNTETQEISEFFSKIQNEVIQNNKQITPSIINDTIKNYINTIDEDYIAEYKYTPDEDRYEIYKDDIVSTFERDNIELTFTTYNNLLEEKNDVIEEKNDVIEEKNYVIEEKNDVIEEKNDVIEEKNDVIEEKNDVIKENNEIKSKLNSIQQIKSTESNVIKESNAIKEKTDAKLEKTNEKKKIIENFDITQKKYNSLSKEFKSKVEAYTPTHEQEQKQLEIKQTLAEKGFDQAEQENYAKQYITFIVAQSTFGSELSKEPGAKEFSDNFIKLKSSLGIIKNIGDIAENKNIAQNTKNIIKNFPSIKEESQKPNQTIDNINIETKDILDYMSDSDVENIKNSKKTIQEQNPNQEIFQENSFLLKEDLEIGENQTDIIEYSKLINTKIIETQQKIELAKDIIKQQITATPFIGISRYLDTEIGGNRLDNDFANNSNSLMSQQNDIINISGTIDNKEIKIRQNMQDGITENNQLQTNSYLTINDQNKISLGDEVMQDIGIILPTKAILSQKAKNRTNKNLQKEIKNGDNIQETISNELGKDLLKNYGHKDIVKNRLAKNIQKSITKQETIGFLERNLGQINEGNISRDSLGGEISQNFKTIKGLILGIDNLSKNECVTFSENLKKFEEQINTFEKDDKLQNDPILKTFNETNSKNAKETRKKSKSEKNPALDFFDNIIKDENGTKKIQIEDFKNIINSREKKEPINSSTLPKNSKITENISKKEDKDRLTEIEESYFA